jgi:hypothetical protein
MALRLVWPAACCPDWPQNWAAGALRRRQRGPVVPNRVPRALAAGCRDVDAELLANGVATNSTPDYMRVATKPGLCER